MFSFRIVCPILISIPFLLPATGHAQSMSIIGGSSFARDCYTAATLAIRLSAGSREDIKKCDRAIAHGRLVRKDLLATYVNRGILYAAIEEYPQALKDYRAAIKLGPGSGEVYVNLGNVYMLGRKYDVAIRQYTTAIELTLAQDHIAHFNRGMAYENNNELNDAEADYRQAIELSPEWLLPQLRLESLLRKARKEKT